jgi:nitric oxide reductase activation protein
MTDDGDERAVPTGAIANKSSKGAKQQRRQDRLKQALRENLKRRKSQARGRDDLTAAPSNIGDASPYDDCGKKSGE